MEVATRFRLLAVSLMLLGLTQWTACADAPEEETAAPRDAPHGEPTPPGAPPQTSAGADAPSRSAAPRVDAPKAPAIELRDLEGNVVRLSDYAGRPVIVDFWATWCGPCVREAPHWLELRARYADEGLEIIGVAVAERRPIDFLKMFVEKQGLVYPIWTGTPKQLRNVVQSYGGAPGLPTTFFLDRDHNIRSRKVGYRSLEALDRYVQQIL